MKPRYCLKNKHLKGFKRKNVFLIPFVFAIGLLCGYSLQQQLAPPSPTPSLQLATDNVKVCFTPSMPCLSLIEQTLNEAKQSIYVQAYSLTSKPIADALILAHQRGVHVEIIADRGQIEAKHTQIYPLKNAGISVWIDTVKGLQHNKVIIVDQTKVICGSYNFSNAAENRNAENFLVITDAKLAKQFLQNWKLRKGNSYPLN